MGTTGTLSTPRPQHPFREILARDAQFKSIHEGTSDKPKLWDIPQNDWAALFKSGMVMKVMDRTKSCSRLKDMTSKCDL